MTALNEAEFAGDVQLAIENAFKGKSYSNYYIAAKSIGTKVIRYLLDNPMFKDAKVVWLTPILQNDEVYNAMVNSNNKGLCIFGEKDSFCFKLERFEVLKNNPNLILRVIDGGNHSLELEKDPIRSIELLKSVIAEINEFCGQ